MQHLRSPLPLLSFILLGALASGCQSSSTPTNEPNAAPSAAVSATGGNSERAPEHAVPGDSAAEDDRSPRPMAEDSTPVGTAGGAEAARSAVAGSGGSAAPGAVTPGAPAKPAAPAKAETPKVEAAEPEAAKAETPKQPSSPTPAEAPAIEKPCLAKSFKFASVKSACEKGGVPRAKSLMKGWTNKAKAKGESYKCATCHDNQRTYTNKPNADADLRKLLDLIK